MWELGRRVPVTCLGWSPSPGRWRATPRDRVPGVLKGLPASEVLPPTFMGGPPVADSGLLASWSRTFTGAHAHGVCYPKTTACGLCRPRPAQ